MTVKLRFVELFGLSQAWKERDIQTLNKNSTQAIVMTLQDYRMLPTEVSTDKLPYDTMTSFPPVSVCLTLHE